jgi:hypothetical protein
MFIRREILKCESISGRSILALANDRPRFALAVPVGAWFLISLLRSDLSICFAFLSTISLGTAWLIAARIGLLEWALRGGVGEIPQERSWNCGVLGSIVVLAVSASMLSLTDAAHYIAAWATALNFLYAAGKAGCLRFGCCGWRRTHNRITLPLQTLELGAAVVAGGVSGALLFWNNVLLSIVTALVCHGAIRTANLALAVRPAATARQFVDLVLPVMLAVVGLALLFVW